MDPRADGAAHHDADPPHPVDDSAPGSPAALDQAGLIAAHERLHAPLPSRIAHELRAGSAAGRGAGARAASTLGTAAEALRLEVVRTGLGDARSLVGHVRGMRLMIPAQGIHGPREAPVLLYLFADALGIRPTDDAPLSAVPLVGLHIVMPHVAVAHWIYRAGRTAHANMGLAREEVEFAASLGAWTIDDFSQADGKLQVLRPPALGPVHLYQHLGLVHLVLERAGSGPVRLKSALVEPAETYVRMYELFDEVGWPSGLTTDGPTGAHEDRPLP